MATTIRKQRLNDDKIKRLTEEVKQLKLRSTITKLTSEPTVQRQVYNWVKQRLREQGITNLEFDKINFRDLTNRRNFAR